MLFVLLIQLLMSQIQSASTHQSLPIIIDTDAGTDDLMAIAYLLELPDLHIEAITVVHGLAHVQEGAHNLRRLLRLAGRDGIPVLEGQTRPIKSFRSFPAEWRKLSDELPGVSLPEPEQPRAIKTAVDFLTERLSHKDKPVRILALGPLSNLALAMTRRTESVGTIKDLVIMGGAVEVSGNLIAGNPEKGANAVAEWNIYCDPDAAQSVFNVPVPKLLVPLDATNRVPIDKAFVDRFTRLNLTPLGRFMVDLFKTAMPLIEMNEYFAWDPLAAMALIDPSVVQTRGAMLQVITTEQNVGQTRLVRWDEDSSLQVAIGARPEAFASSFLAAFTKK